MLSNLGYQLKTISSLNVCCADSNGCEEVNDMAAEATALQVSCQELCIEVGGNEIETSTLLSGTKELY
jgi:hypothetical protein